MLTREVERLVSEQASEGEDAAVAAIAALLGRRTAEMHLCLAGGAPGFEPEPFSLLWQRSILQSLRASLRETQRALRRARKRFAEDEAALAAAVVDDGDRLLATFEPLRTRKLDARRIRVHGDFHLGQALWTGRDVVLIDFEGEPGMSAGARAIKRSPLMDVGGLVRSFDYAGRVAIATSERARSQRRGAPPGARRVAAQVDVARPRPTCSGRTSRRSTSRPRVGRSCRTTPHDRTLLLDAHVLLKALYEVRYELANRPSWVSWPLAGIDAMLAEREQ